eukprot:COSAG02_NODE_658_length_18775_cov_3.825712_10_plen_560_part_00
MMENGLAQFMHFSVDTFGSIEHNCVPVNTSKCLPASTFNPGATLDTDQWVEAAVAMGAGEICLTAHHEGGFCLWDTRYSNYSVMNSPYGKDVVAQFVRSCTKYDVKPCFYMGPNANGYLMQEHIDGPTYVKMQLGMLRELLTKYGNGTDYVSRLWWDHYAPWPDGCSGDPNVACPVGSFPDAWIEFVQLVRKISPSTILCPGPDCDGHQGENMMGSYPMWLNCEPNSAPNTPPGPKGELMSCGNHAPSGSRLSGFHPYETCGTLLRSGYFCRKGACGPAYTPREIWDHYMQSVGIGWVNTVNAPPGTDGLIPAALVSNMRTFGDHLRKLLQPLANKTASGTVTCGGAPLVLQLPTAVTFNAVILREDLAQGQRVGGYTIDYWHDDTGSWHTFEPCRSDRCFAPKPVPPVANGACGPIEPSTNLIHDASHYGPCLNCHLAGETASATACETLCNRNETCRFWTWHDLTNPDPWKNRCYLRNDTFYDPSTEAGHFSGICNHSLPQPLAGGIHGQSIGSRLIDFVPDTTARKVRFRCLKSLAADEVAHIRSFSLHRGHAPAA